MPAAVCIARNKTHNSARYPAGISGALCRKEIIPERLCIVQLGPVLPASPRADDCGGSRERYGSVSRVK